MAIKRKPRLLTKEGREISVTRWIECNPSSDFGTAVFEIDYKEDQDNIRHLQDVVLDVEGERFDVRFNRFVPAETIWVSGRLSQIRD